MRRFLPSSSTLPPLLAWRYLRGRRSRLLSGTARASLISICLGVAAMIIAMALMTGYTEDLKRKLVGGSAAVVGYPLGSEEAALTPETVTRIEALTGVREVGLVVYGQGSLGRGPEHEGLDVTLRGVEPGKGELSGSPDQLQVGEDGIPGAVVGSELARRLAAEKGQVMRLVAVGFDGQRPRFHYQSLRISGTFTTGFSEFDRHWVILDRTVVVQVGGRTRRLEVTLWNPQEAGEIRQQVADLLGPDFLVADWRDLNRELFTALALQKAALFVILGLIVLVSTFNVASSLVVLVRERIRDIGVLGALGLKPQQLSAVFVLYGASLGAAGALIGVALGWGIAWTLTTFELIRFEPEVAAVYFISSVPFRVRVADVILVIAFTLAVTLIGCWLPARRAARVDPSAALRYE